MPELGYLFFEVMVYSLFFIQRFPLFDFIDTFQHATVEMGTDGIGDVVLFAIVEQGMLV